MKTYKAALFVTIVSISALGFAAEKKIQRSDLPVAVEKALQQQLSGATIKALNSPGLCCCMTTSIAHNVLIVFMQPGSERFVIRGCKIEKFAMIFWCGSGVLPGSIGKS